jgi:predicted RNA binding protein YcfA (HicA-like mRNA interferase family)
VNFRDFIRILKDNNFVLARQKGAHRQYEGFHSGKRWLVTVAYHRESDDIAPNTLDSMIWQ